MKHTIYGDTTSDICLIQPVDGHDMEQIENEYEIIRSGCDGAVPLLVAVHTDDWDKDLSPWEVHGVFGKEGFGNGAPDTLSYITKELIPQVRCDYFNDAGDVKYIIGGYSLAGLFALWSAYQTDIFSGCVAASPSVWFLNWMEYAATHTIKAKAVYLSLGRKEPKAKNPLMRTVGDCIMKQDELLGDIPHVFEWNEGNHFSEPDIRTAKGFVWAIKRCCEP